MATRKRRKRWDPRTRKRPAAVREQQRTLDRVLDRQVLIPTQNTFDVGVGEMNRRLSRAVRARVRTPTAADRRKLQQVIRNESARMHAQIGRNLAYSAEETLVESLQAQARLHRRLYREGSILENPALLEDLVDARVDEIELRRQTILREMHRETERRLQRVLQTLPADASVADAIEAVSVELEGQRYRFERLARTETSYAFNVAQSDAIEALNKSGQVIWKRWTEKVSDYDRTPLDNRVGDDSIVLHGQIAKPGETFVMPADPKAPSGMVGKRWAFPPNRPNDRAMIVPWKPGSGVPAYVMRGAERVEMR